MATLTGGRTGRSTLSPCDTPDGFHPAPDALSRAGAEAAWRSVTLSIAATPHVRVSRDGGRTFPARHARPLPDDPPGQPATVAVYDPGSATGRMLALDLDPSRIRIPAGVDDRAVQDGHEHRAGPAAEVAAQAVSIAGLMARRGGQNAPTNKLSAPAASALVRQLARAELFPDESPGPRRRVTLQRPPRLRPVRRGAALARAARPRPGDRPPVPRRRPGANVVHGRSDQPSGFGPGLLKLRRAARSLGDKAVDGLVGVVLE